MATTNENTEGEIQPSDDNSLDTSEATTGVPSSQEQGVDDVERPKVARVTIFVMGIVLVILFIGVLYGMYIFWPGEIKNSIEPCSELTNGVCLTSERKILVLVLLAGMLGSLIHAGTSFSNFVGDRKLEKSWIWWYALRPFIGMAVALVFYVIFRGGLLADSKAENLNNYGIMTVSILAGLFTDRATIKLKEIFETLFKPDDNRKGALNKNANKDFDADKAES